MYHFKIVTSGFYRVAVGVICTLLFVLVLSFSLFHMSKGMDVTGNTSGCPFMADGTSVCSMSTLDHISAWQSTFLTIVPSFIFLLVMLSTLLILVTVAPNLLVTYKDRKLLPSKYFRERVYTFPYRSLQELFSDGILHPKLF